MPRAQEVEGDKDCCGFPNPSESRRNTESEVVRGFASRRERKSWISKEVSRDDKGQR
jgi:hypothetical protein